MCVCVQMHMAVMYNPCSSKTNVRFNACMSPCRLLQKCDYLSAAMPFSLEKHNQVSRRDLFYSSCRVPVLRLAQPKTKSLMEPMKG